ncbi:tRNA 2-thiouridine(34) synthase MnmA [Caldichromatium japonicum]|uniref:tRNA-specific 2-thiouridylase MnmA n=1 Tax=Caldichromatium japonicum TaxID=2699430 RepID=A0A6G7VG26_9GAMM|nr:tRNA 2-thiouridine(34) synthase MnmA [Caldichromatium japonicum]QIK38999.1 tRNA 2-thiouridine(34) synthase MnmA [Caldichromatium japonicum]
MKTPHQHKIIVGLSGGVDSAIAAYRLIESGQRVEAVFMKNWEEDDRPGYCAAAADLADARAVAERLGIELHTVNFAAEYWDRVFAYFLREYRALRTPNPDVLCNSEIKFAAFLDYALALGAQAIATGHYARLVVGEEGYELHRARDEGKDQTYFLHRLDQGQLAHACFPLADLTKPEVRALAQRLDLPNAAKKDSTGICFIGERRFAEFLARYLPSEPGAIETPEGIWLGEHQGLAHYTIGQRQGLGIGGVRGQQEAPWYVAAKDPVHNRLIVVQGQDHPLLLSHLLEASNLHWISGQPPSVPLRCLARLRHRQPLQPCELIACDASICQVRFARPQRAVTPGQSIVFYQGTRCLGGAIIERGLRLD